MTDQISAELLPRVCHICNRLWISSAPIYIRSWETIHLRTALIAGGISLMIAGCSIHPLPEDATSLPTNAIVNHIRCEARYAFANAAGLYLSKTSALGTYGSASAPLLINRHLDIHDLDLARLTSEQKRNIEKYLSAAIAYDFTFDMTEDNAASAGIDVGNVFPRSVLNVGIGLAIDRLRQNIRNFRISDTFGELRSSSGYCTKYQANIDYDYPISGEIGLAEMVTTFVDLNQFQNLTPAKDAKDKAPTLADQLIFTTTKSGSVSPKITLTPLQSGLRLSDASLNISASRKDSHKVIVALSLPPKKGAQSCIASGGLLAGSSSGNFSRTPAERCAFAEIDTQVQRNIITNLAVRQGP